MKTTIKAVALICLNASVLTTACPVHAHHSFAAEYDVSKPITLTGTITKIEWTNPHIFIYLNVPDEQTNAVVNWTLEMGGPNALLRLGWKRDSLKVGDAVTVEGSLAKNGSPLVNAKSIVMTATGKKMLAGSSAGATAAEER
jgi:Family of unknown function (DUF6152)